MFILEEDPGGRPPRHDIAKDAIRLVRKHRGDHPAARALGRLKSSLTLEGHRLFKERAAPLDTMLGRGATVGVALAILVISSIAVVSVGASRSGDHPSAPDPRFATDITPLPPGARADALPGSYRVAITVGVSDPAEAQLGPFLAALENPHSAEYRQFLTESQFDQRFAPTATETNAVVAALRSAGGQGVAAFPDRSAVSATLSVSAVRELFGVQLVSFGGSNDRPEYTAIGTVHLAPSLAGRVASVSGLSDTIPTDFSWNLVAAPLRPVHTAGGVGQFVEYTNTSSEWFIGSDFTQTFGATELFPGSGSVANATFPTHVAIATLLASGYNSSLRENLPPYDPKVVSAYFNGTQPKSWPLPNISGAAVTINNVTPPAPGTFGAVNDSSLDEYENSLDLEMAGSLAPGASIVNFYFAGSLLAQATSSRSVADDFAFSLSQALAHNYSPARLAVVSGSFGLPDLNDSTWNFEAEEAAATGVTIDIASGDQGNAPDSMTGRDDGQWPTWPATADTDTSGAIAVGGVSVTLGGRPTAEYSNNGSLNLSYDSNLTGITSLSAWYDTSEGVAGTEGGMSTVFSEPYWQKHSAAQPAIRNATIQQGASTLGRAEPDLAMPANDTIATVWANASEGVYFTVLEGTSVAAPVVAGLLADVVAVNSNRSASGWAPLGFLDPTLYNLSSYFAANPSSADPFTSVTVGSNYVFSAAAGWDALTGWGVVNASLLLAALEDPTVSDYHYTGPTPGLPPSNSSPTAPIPWVELSLILGLGVVAAIVIIVVSMRPRRAPPGAPIPPGAQSPSGAPYGPGVQGGIYPGATFLCPYCGAVRPAQPVRCPQCGAF
jgi:subtilase family serine protease